ncbi:MAG: 2-oxoglutarate dehydrogenase complex dihydrolipoyllysine-residue succinyltransferase [Bacteroidia bacterium]|nr:2-oxoglutarate dehydrogenase complex dihydrolipoyllysine-residue succinyltransferase [Bacteroidia bacterium]
MLLEVKVPSPGESVTEVTIETWYKKTGDYVKKDEHLADIQSDKAMLALYAEEAGILNILVEAGSTVAVGTVVCTIDTAAQPQVSQPTISAPAASATVQDKGKEQSTSAVTSSATTESYAKGWASPAAEKLIVEKQLNKETIIGTGLGGRITKADVVQALAQQPAIASAPRVERKPEVSVPAASVAPSVDGRSTRIEKISQLRKTLAHRLVSVKNETAMLTTFNEVDLSAIVEIRKKYKERFQQVHEVGLGFMSFFTKACCYALKEFPQVNAYFLGDSIEYHDYVDMGIAVSTDRGLVVPVIRNAETLSLAEIEAKIVELANKARKNQITIQEMTGGTFTITNGGVFGSLMSTPILNPPQSAILGMHKVQERPVVVNGEIQIRPMMYVALSYDHRIIDGKESVSFLVRVKEYLEDPIRLLLNV